MVIAKVQVFDHTTNVKSEEVDHRDDISAFPLAIPLIAKPSVFLHQLSY